MEFWSCIRVIAGEDGCFNYPSGITCDKEQKKLYITDMYNHRVCSVDEDTGKVDVLNNEIRESKKYKNLKKPLGITCASGKGLYVTDAGHNAIFYKDDTKEYWTLLADGEGSFNLPSGISVDEQYNVYTNDFLNNRILKVSHNSEVEVLVGGEKQGYKDGSLKEAKISKPYGICYHKNKLFFVDSANGAVRNICFDKSKVKTLSMPVGDEKLLNLVALGVEPSGNIYACEQRRLFYLDSKDNSLKLILDRKMWEALRVKFKLKNRLTYLGAITVPTDRNIYWIDTLKGLVYNMKLNTFMGTTS